MYSIQATVFLQSISLRKCGISDDPSEYFLAEMIDSSHGEERKLDPVESPFNIKGKTAFGLIKLYIRYCLAIACLGVRLSNVPHNLPWCNVDL